jgi:uncharacterized protein YbjT (DUF2867 family)
MILVVGATGMLGGQVCRNLAQAGRPVRAMVRTTSDPAKVAALRAMGAEVVQGDLRDAASLVAACRGADAVIETVSAMPFSYVAGENDIGTTDTGGSASLVAAARLAGVTHFVYTSFSRNIDDPFPLRDAKRATEALLRSSGMDYTILRPSCFMEVWLTPAVGFDYPNGKATIYGTGDAGISYIAVPDVAEFAVRSLDASAARNAVLELGGPQPVSQMEAVRTFERAAGRSFETTHVPVEALDAQYDAATDPMQRSFAGLMRCVARGDTIDMSPALEALPVRLTSVTEYAEKVGGRTPVLV